jgi:hypothetical protein
MYEVGVVSNGITFVPNFVKICQFQNLKVEATVITFACDLAFL